MRPLKGTLSAPFGTFARVRVATVSVRVQRLACARLSLSVGARQLWACCSPGADRVIAICSFAAADSVKRKLVPSGFLLAEIAVGCFPTRKSLWVSLTALIVSFAALIAGGELAAWIATVLKDRSEPAPVPSTLVAETRK